MPFSEGQIVVHPAHGPVEVTKIHERKAFGDTVTYLDLTALRNSLRISVPLDRADEVGLRLISTPEYISGLLTQLRDDSPPQEAVWSRRMKDYQARMATGTLESHVYLIREISRRGAKTRATTEGQLLRLARAALAEEIDLSLHCGLAEAEALIDEQLDAQLAADALAAEKSGAAAS